MSRQSPSTTQSTLAEVCALLRLPCVKGAASLDARFVHKRLKPGARLVAQGEPLEALYVVRSGTLKTFVAEEDGNQVVLAFPMRGDLVGADGLCDRTNTSFVVALDEAEVVAIPFGSLSLLRRALDDFELLMYQAISRELVAEHSLRSLIGSLGAEARVARFLARHAQRLGASGASASRFRLAMSRQEIGGYLGLTIETVSRAFSALQDAGFIRVEQRELEILDANALRTLDKVTTRRVAPVASNAVATPARVRRSSGPSWQDMLGEAA